MSDDLLVERLKKELSRTRDWEPHIQSLLRDCIVALQPNENSDGEAAAGKLE